MAPIVRKYYPHIYNCNSTLEAVSLCVPYLGGKNALIQNSTNFIKTDHFQLMVI